MKNIVRGHFAALVQAQLNLGVLGNSLFLPHNAYNISASLPKLLPYPCRGFALCPHTSHTYPGSFILSASGTVVVADRRPGEDHGDGDLGWHHSRSMSYIGNSQNFGSPIQFQVTRSGFYDNDWDLNVTLRPILVYRSNTADAGYATWRLYGRTASGAGGNYDLISPTLNAAPNQQNRVFLGTAMARGAGTGALLQELQPNSATETSYLKLLSIGVRNEALSQGIFFAPVLGDGSCRLAHYRDDTARVVPLQGYSYRVTDEALRAWYNAYRVNYLLMPVGANEISLSEFAADLDIVTARHRRIAAEFGIDLKIGFISQYDFDGSESATAFRDIMYAFCRTRSFTEMADFMAWQRKTYGHYSLWNSTAVSVPARQLQDNIHPLDRTTSTLLQDNLVNFFHSTMMGPRTSFNTPAPISVNPPPLWLTRTA